MPTKLMPTTFNRRAAATVAFAAAALLGTAALPAQAQQARYCNGTLASNSFYSNVLSNGRTAEVEYHGQFQNTDPNRRALTATMLRVQRIGNFTVLRPVARFDLNSYEQKDVTLLAVSTNNPSGNGAPSPSQVGQSIVFSCSFR